MSKVMRVGIEFNDNDFYLTMDSFMRVLMSSFEIDGLPTGLSRGDIARAFNSIAPTLYFLNQNPNKYSHGRFNPSKYLQISEDDVYFDDEIDTFMKANEGTTNGEFFFYDHNSQEIFCI